LPIWLPTALCVGLFAIWSGWWLIVRDGAGEVVDATLETWRAQGLEVVAARSGTGGYPFRVHVDLAEVALTSPEGWAWSVDRARVNILPYNFNQVIVDLGERHALDIPRLGPVTATTQALRWGGRSAADGALAETSLDVRGLDARRAAADGDSGGAVVATLDMGRAYLRREPEAPQDYRVFLGLDRPYWPQVGNAGPDRVLADATVGQGAVILAAGTLDEAALRAWAAAGGALDIRDARLVWGASAIGVRGKLTLDPAGAWSGELTILAEDPATAIAKLRDLKLLDARTADQAAGLLTSMAGEEGRIEIPLIVRAGKVRLLGFDVTELPRAF
jgi:hypothetical protein